MTSVPREALRALVAALAGVSAYDVLWDGEPVPFVSGQGQIRLNPVSRRSVGVDEEKRDYPTPTTVQRTLSGQRALTVSVRAENYREDEGYDVLELVRTLICADENRALLNVAGLSLASVGDVRTFNVNVNNRAISVASMDLFLNQRVETVLAAVEADTYVETVEGDLEGDLDGGVEVR